MYNFSRSLILVTWTALGVVWLKVVRSETNFVIGLARVNFTAKPLQHSGFGVITASRDDGAAVDKTNVHSQMSTMLGDTQDRDREFSDVQPGYQSNSSKTIT